MGGGRERLHFFVIARSLARVCVFTVVNSSLSVVYVLSPHPRPPLTNTLASHSLHPRLPLARALTPSSSVPQELALVNYCDKYLCAFLNSGGGTLYFGVQDDGRVNGVELDRDGRDIVRLGADRACQFMEPSVLPRSRVLRRVKMGSGVQCLGSRWNLAVLRVSLGPHWNLALVLGRRRRR